MNEMVDRVAQAIYESTWVWDGKSYMLEHGWESIADTATGNRYRQFACAALLAIARAYRGNVMA